MSGHPPSGGATRSRAAPRRCFALVAVCAVLVLAAGMAGVVGARQAEGGRSPRLGANAEAAAGSAWLEDQGPFEPTVTPEPGSTGLPGEPTLTAEPATTPAGVPTVTSEPDPGLPGIPTVTPESSPPPGPTTAGATSTATASRTASATASRTATASPTATATASASHTPVAGTLSNVSTRGWVGTGHDVMIGGLIFTGGNADLIFRALGPSLRQHGVPDVLEDPTLDIHDSNDQHILHCDNWRDCPGASELGALAPSDPREPALKLNLPPGRYTAIVRGKGGTTGIALVEAFHAGGSGQLVNVSTRGKVLTGDRVMIGGAIVRGGAADMVFRGIGPSLRQHGVQGVLEDPTLDIHDGRQTPIDACDDWQTCTGAALLGALAPSDPREPALRLRVGPDGYTGIVRGKHGAVGVALVEFFAVK